MGYDWTKDESLSPDEIRERVAGLPQADIVTESTAGNQYVWQISNLATGLSADPNPVIDNFVSPRPAFGVASGVERVLATR